MKPILLGLLVSLTTLSLSAGAQFWICKSKDGSTYFTQGGGCSAGDTGRRSDGTGTQTPLQAQSRSDPVAQNDLGNAYYMGRGVPQDYREAARLFRLAASHGNANAQVNLGAMYSRGEGVPKDYSEALKWFRLSAAQGNEFAQAQLGAMYEGGLGVTINYQEAIEWYRLAAHQGNADAQYRLGRIYHFGGNGVPQDWPEAMKWYKLAADQGAAEARSNLAMLTSNTRTAVDAPAPKEVGSRKKDSAWSDYINSFAKGATGAVVIVVLVIVIALLQQLLRKAKSLSKSSTVARSNQANENVSVIEGGYMTDGTSTAMWIRVIAAASVLWILVALGIIFAEYLFRDPSGDHYFWQMPAGGNLNLLATPEELIRKLEPRVLQIAFVLLGPIAVFWTVGWLTAWAKRAQS